MLLCAEYLWLDGSKPTKQLRSKTRVLQIKDDEDCTLSHFPEWGFDGSSTFQSAGNNSDLVLKPVRFVSDPLRGGENYLVLCEVNHSDDSPHESNSRAQLRHILDQGGDALDAWVGIEQEYTLFQNGRPLAWPEQGYPGPQGPYYCGVGAESAFGREIAENHLQACLDAELLIFGTNGEVMPSQWEFQIGHRGFENEKADPLLVSDHLWFARWLLKRIAEDFDVQVSFDQKPMAGDWNGAGAHTNISTKTTRDLKSGWQAIQNIVKVLSQKHDDHIKMYGHGLEMRLTGHHETCDIHTFRSGEKDRGASIRIPDNVAKKRSGYFEDRRPGANCDPYQVCTRLIESIMLA